MWSLAPSDKESGGSEITKEVPFFPGSKSPATKLLAARMMEWVVLMNNCEWANGESDGAIVVTKVL